VKTHKWAPFPACILEQASLICTGASWARLAPDIQGLPSKQGDNLPLRRPPFDLFKAAIKSPACQDWMPSAIADIFSETRRPKHALVRPFCGSPPLVVSAWLQGFLRRTLHPLPPVPKPSRSHCRAGLPSACYVACAAPGVRDFYTSLALCAKTRDPYSPPRIRRMFSRRAYV
jgi:hypothetical protein